MTVKTTTHTPGPWEIGPKGKTVIDGFPVNRYAISGSGTAIASVWAGDPRKALKGVKHEGKANARLIAAAPNLALILELCAIELEYLAGDLQNGYERDAASKAKLARKALKKAGVKAAL